MAVPTPRPRARLLACCAAVLAAAVASEARADEPAPAAKLVALRLEWHRQQARLEAAGWETELIARPRAGGEAVGRRANADLIFNELRPALVAEYEAFRTAALKLAKEAEVRREEARGQWAEVYGQRIAFRRHTDQQQAVYKFDFDTGAQPAFQPTVFDAGVVVWAAVVFAVAVRLGKNVRRVSIRKAQRAVAVASLLGLFTASGCSNGPAPDARAWDKREEAALTAEANEYGEKADAATAVANLKWAATVDAWAALVAGGAGAGAGGQNVEAVLRAGEADARDQLRAAAVDARLADRLAKEAADERGQLAADRTKLAELTSGAKVRAVAFTAARCAGAALLFGLAVAPHWRARRKEAAQVKADARKCPRCFGERLVVERSGAPPTDDEDDPKPAYRGAKGKSKAKTAAADAPQETGYVECKSCSFKFLRSYQKVRRLCFPVVGVPSSGKTHMLATGYDKVRKRTAPTVAVVQPAPSLGDKRFETYIDLILNRKKEAGNTVHALPDPVMLHLRDADPAGPNTALVNLFDYSGELLNEAIDEKRLKKQAVRMDGFMLFLDPTQLEGGGRNLSTLDEQIAKLNEFMADMREERNVPVGQVIPVPVAVVVPKFDLLVTENPIQGQSVPFIRRLLAEMNPPPKRTTLGTIQGRSAVVEQMLELMFRGVDIRGLVESYFGGQVMFFPVSSVSLIEHELGIKDLSKRTIVPFGVAEPFLWLLHMHGYEVFA